MRPLAVRLVTVLAGLTVLAGCTDPARSDPATTAAVDRTPLTSIPFCADAPDGPDAERTATATALASQLADHTSADGRVEVVYFHPGLDRIVVRLGRDDGELRAEIDGLAGEPVRYVIGAETIASQQAAAHEALLAVQRRHPDAPIGSSGRGSDGLVHLWLYDLAAADTLAADWGIPEPLERYCVEQRLSDDTNVPGAGAAPAGWRPAAPK